MIELRAPTPEDLPALVEAMNLPGHRKGTIRLPHVGAADVQGLLLGCSPNKRPIVAEVDGRTVGYGALLLRDGRQRHMGEVFVFVHDDHWGRGIGRALMEALLDLADNWLGLLRVELEAAPGNTRAIALYESLGFVHEGRKRGDVISDGMLEDTIVMGRLRPAPALEPMTGGTE